MSNKEQLQLNNATLDGYITRINTAKDTVASLPDAGGSGGTTEIVTITLGMPDPGCTLVYIDENNTFQTVDMPMSGFTFNIPKCSFFASNGQTYPQNATCVGQYGMWSFYQVI